MFKIPDKPVKQLNQVPKENLNSVLFILAGLEGNCDCFHGLAEQLEQTNIQVYGLEYSKNVPTDSVDSISKFYIKLIEENLSPLGLTNFNLAGYSFGGLISIEICRQIEFSSNLKIQNLIIIESSHTFFRFGVHSNSKQFGKCIHNRDILMQQNVYTATLSIYLSYIIGASGKQFRFDLYKYLNEIKIKNLDEALEEAFEYIKKNKLFDFENDQELIERKEYLKILMLKSNAALIYTYDKRNKLKTKTSLIKTPVLLYKDLNLFYMDESDKRVKLDFNVEDFDLKEIIENVNNFKIFILNKGNHFSFGYDSLDELTNIFLSLIKNFVKSKI